MVLSALWNEPRYWFLSDIPAGPLLVAGTYLVCLFVKNMCQRISNFAGIWPVSNSKWNVDAGAGASVGAKGAALAGQMKMERAKAEAQNGQRERATGSTVFNTILESRQNMWRALLSGDTKQTDAELLGFLEHLQYVGLLV